MKRRDFLKSSAFSAIAISATGFIRFDGKQYTGDCETTSDILGPYYRPNSPVRNNLRINGDAGELVELSGYIRHSDCSTPYKNAKIELWHCDLKGIYDNQSGEFRYRGTVFTDEKGFYSFQTIFPVAYAGEGFIRPAHFHMMVTAEGYQPLITQLYFKGDEHIKDDVYASSPNAKRRI
jgi:protocatechuate 3,4-dioxygenase beta subunit